MDLEHAIQLTWPASGRHKVIQVELRGISHLEFKAKEGARHYAMLTAFLQAHGVNYQFEGDGLVATPARTGEGYRVLGMGNATIDAAKKEAIFSGQSGDYLIGIDREQLQTLRTQYPDWDIVG